MIVETDGTIRYESPAIERVLGYGAEERVGKNAFKYVHPEDAERVRRGLERTVAGDGVGPPVEYRLRHADGSWRYVESIANNLLDDPGIRGVVINSRDVTERKALEEQLEHRAFHDSLTGLPNRALFMDRLEHALSRMDRRKEPVAVLFLDLNNFKLVNDSFGHEVGDRLLVAAAGRLKECVRPEDTIARLGGDEFTVLLEGIPDRDGAAHAAERIVEALQAPFDLAGQEVFTSASIGVALAAEAPDGSKDLLRNADLALYEAKRRGRAQYEVFDAGMSAETLERFDLGNDLRRALGRGEFKIYYQPNVSFETGEIVSLEALVRWEHPERGLLEPKEFLPVAEETGLILPIGRWVLGEVCQQGRAWQDEFLDHPPPKVCINISPKQFSQADLVEDVARALRETGLRAGGLSLEVAERILTKDAESAIGKLRALKDLGVHVVVDNFGVGYSSLSHLKRFPLNLLKIDRSLIAELGEGPKDTAIMAATINLAHALNWAATAHGVETAEQLTLLRELGCDVAQGYYFSKPVTSEEIPALLEAGPHRRSEPDV